MAQVLWDIYLSAVLRRFLARSLVFSVGHAGQVVSYWAGLHDVGKVMACFQALNPAAFGLLSDYPVVAGEKRRHDHAGHVWIGRELANQGYVSNALDSPAFMVAQLLGGHHGRFRPRNHQECRYPAVAVMKELGQGRWEEQRRALLAHVCRIVDPPEAPSRLPVEAAALVCGLVILADWLVSQDDHLVQRLAAVPSHVDDLDEHYRRSMQLAPVLFDRAGLSPVRFRQATFADSFPAIKEPNDLQRSISGAASAPPRTG
jgi:CRISPR-associated endonuclease/helicase Cas3